MTDIFSADKRSEIMRSVRTRNTAPEAVVRSVLRRLRVSYSSNASRLPGTPDLVVSHFKLAIFVNGCLWHGHERCSRAKVPVQNRSVWVSKIAGNRRRDRRVTAALRKLGYTVLTVWACQTKHVATIERRIRAALARRNSLRRAARSRSAAAVTRSTKAG